MPESKTHTPHIHAHTHTKHIANIVFHVLIVRITLRMMPRILEVICFRGKMRNGSSDLGLWRIPGKRGENVQDLVDHGLSMRQDRYANRTKLRRSREL